MRTQQGRKIRDWAFVLCYTLFIYITLPLMPDLWRAFSKSAGNFANYLAALVLGLIGLFILIYLFFSKKSIHNFIWLAILVSSYAWGLSMLELPIERVHFIEYGLLSLLVFRALRHNIGNNSLYFWSGIIVFFLGLFDEGIQYILPNRYYEIRDVLVNGVAGILGLFVIGLCFQPKLGNPK